MRRLSLVAAALVIASIAACESLVTDPVPYGTIRVRAVGRDSQPLPGLEVELYTGFAPHGYHTTNANGVTVFTRVPQQQYGVQMKLGSAYGLLQEILPETSKVVVSGINVTAATDTTFTFSNVTAAKAQAFVVELTVTGSATPTWPAAVEWDDGLDGDPGPGKHLLGFVTFNGGTSWIGVAGASNVS